MDKKDAKILISLLRNSRNSLSSIGREVGLSRENIHYRLQNLKQSIIRGFVTEINIAALGFQQYTCFLQLQKLSKDSEMRIIDYLLKSHSISWIGRLAGKWSLTFDIFAKNELEVDAIMAETIRFCGEQYDGHALLTVAQGFYFFEKLLGDTLPPSPSKRVQPSLDSIDKELLKQLNENSRVTYAQLSTDLDLTANAIRNRIRKLEDTGVIVRYSISIDQKTLGYDWQGVQVKLSIPSEKAENKLLQFLQEHPRTTFVYQYTRRGTHEFDIGVATKTHIELKDFIDELRKIFAGDVEIENTFVVLDELSSHKLPPKVFE